jgi:hypothetical protein
MYTHASSTYPLLLLVLGHVWFVSGCGGDATVSAGETPMHYHMVCVSPADAQKEPCDTTESLSFFQTWVQEAISLPHSTFTIWAVDPARNQYHKKGGFHHTGETGPQWHTTRAAGAG